MSAPYTHASKLNASNQRGVRMCRQHLALGNKQSYALGMSALIRAADDIAAVRALWLCVDEDGMGDWLDGSVLCPIAKEAA